MGRGPRARRRPAAPSHRVLRSHSRRARAPSPSPSSDYMEKLSPRQVRELRRELVQRLREKMDEQLEKRKELQEVQEEVAEMRQAVKEQEEKRAQQEAPPGPGPAGQGQSDQQVVVSRRRSPRLQQQRQRMLRPRLQLSPLPTITEEDTIVVAVQEEQRQGKPRRRRRSRLQREKKSGSRLLTPTRTEEQITVVVGPLPPPSPPRYELTTFFRFSIGLPEDPTRLYHKGILNNCYLFGYALRSLMTAARELMWLPIPHFLTWRGATTRLIFLIEQSVRREHRQALVNPYKNFIIRLALERDGTIGVTARLMTERNHACFWPAMLLSPRISLDIALPVPVYIDTMPTPFSLHLRHCTSNKTILNASRARVGLGGVGSREADVLLYDHAGMVCGTPSSTIYFYREGQHYTPDISTGCLAGASFAWAMERNLAKQAFIPLDQIFEGERVWLSNAVNGFYRGIIARRHEVPGP